MSSCSPGAGLRGPPHAQYRVVNDCRAGGAVVSRPLAKTGGPSVCGRVVWPVRMPCAEDGSRFKGGAGGPTGPCDPRAMSVAPSVQVQASTEENAVGTQHNYRSTRHALRSIVQERGVLGLWRGLDALMPRVLALVSVQLTTYDMVKQWLLLRGHENSLPTHFMSSAVASFCATIAMQPFDLVAARIMNQPTEHGRGLLYSGPWDCMTKIVRAEGVMALTKGGLSNYCRVGPQYILTFIFFEKMKAMWAEYKAQGSP